MKPRAKRVVLGLLAVVIVVEVFYLLAANLFLGTGLGPKLINRKPERFEIQWDSAWTALPGLVHAKNLRIRQQSRAVQGFAHLDEARLRIHLLPLMSRHFRISRAEIQGVDLRLRRRSDAPGRDASQAGPPPASPPKDHTPPIPGLTNPPSPTPEDLYPHRKDKKGWKLTFDNIEATDLRQFWIDNARYVGSGQLAGGLHMEIRGPLEMKAASLSLDGGHVLVGETKVAKDVKATADLHFDSFVPQEHRGLEALRFLSGTLSLDADVDGARPVDFFFRGNHWVSIEATGPIHSLLEIDHGELAAGTSIEVGPGDIEVSYLGYRASGSGSVSSRVEASKGGLEEEGGSTGWVTARLDSFEVAQDGINQPHIRGLGFELRAETSDLQLAKQKPQGSVDIRLPLSEVPDLAHYNRFLPRDSGFEVVSGAGRLKADFHLETQNGGDKDSVLQGLGRGSIELRSSNARVRFEDLAAQGTLHLKGELPSIDIEKTTFDLDGTTLSLTDVAFTTIDSSATPKESAAQAFRRLGNPNADNKSTARGWWMNATLPKGAARLSPPTKLETYLTAELRDSGPLVAGMKEIKPSLRWISRLLEVDSVEASAELQMNDHSLSISEAQVEAEKLEILADLVLAQGKPKEALMFFRRGRLSAAVEIHGSERQWKVFGSRKWFEEQASSQPSENSENSENSQKGSFSVDPP